MNTLKLKRIQQIVAAAGIALAALMYTGCMVTPGDGENLTNRSDTVEVYGYAANLKWEKCLQLFNCFQ